MYHIFLQTIHRFSDTCAGIISNNKTVIENCNLDSNFMQGILTPFTYMLGGYTPIIIWALISLMVYMKYKSAIAALITAIPILTIGTVAMPEYASQYIFIVGGVVSSAAIYFFLSRINRG